MLTRNYKKRKQKGLKRKARERHQDLSEEEKIEKRQYAPERCKYLSEEKNEKRQYCCRQYETLSEYKKQALVEYK